jgi:tyrosine-specific transport protein
MKERPQLEAVSTLVGTVIGAGVLGIPYLVAKSGLLNGVLLILVLGAAVTLMYLYYGEIILRTRKIHQLTGYAEKYLGKTGKIVATFSFIIGLYGALTAYILGSGSAFSSILGGNSLLYSLGFLLVGGILVYIGLKAVEESEFILMFLVLGLVLIICFFAAGKITAQNLTGLNVNTLLLPYGVVLFALLGTNALPEMREELIRNEKLFKRSIIIGMLIPILVYILFSVVVVGAIGLQGFESLEPDKRLATIALIPSIGAHMAIFGNLFAILAMFTSFLSTGLSLKDMFIFDFRLDARLAFLLTFIPPAIIAISQLTSFIEVLDLMGIIVGGITALLIVFMFWRAKRLGDRKPEYTIGGSRLVGSVILLLFLIGTFYKLLGN